ncbi:MAG: SDR family NAD(P)-dependent oxidoreductase [Rhizobiaceae bacterium]|nr:SDR family NAD(P)-dependent oxidoreductase [Rhizobiaceae bacterium]MCV0406389.1 SDR family NAD(P)-dependent oxidoreductase [Rhizobiaceae bacterium]
MALYRADPKDGLAWVTGASSGIGRQLALDLARQGYTVAATARSQDKLASLSAEAAAEGKGKIFPFPADVTEMEAMAATVDAIEREHGPIVLGILNAGGSFPSRGDALVAGNFVATFEVNVFGIVHGLVPLVERMRSRGRGHVAFVGSISGYVGLPLAAAYGASKSAVNTMAEALKFDLDPMNIRLQVINPGFVKTPLTERNTFPMPALMTVEDASKRIVTGLRTGGFEVTFPRRLSYVLKLMKLVPHWGYFPLMKRVTGRNRRDTKSPQAGS